ncbi:hypothetical protein [Priestia megaterium]|jgi:hypothetical protein|uniref:hypothetical protein n=1 Tax=Priestia TaxID=2800373 RepID=UPI00211D266D|nr:hypothetical protein [Priestia megaterium]MCR8862469.1 hypothetical protein [Priestia megaterium]MDP1438352.1 hypothetical protein [Priestia megaterium]MDP1467369.1 hypothetical protein [Priestia megaterium]MDR0130441.1 hypothetical protein [Priestia megaterium]MDR7202093.1 hypothetical protein [Priestia megaterium]
MKNYLNVEEGKNSWKRYVSTTILASVFMLLGSIIYIIAEMIMVADDESGKSYFDFDSGVAVGINANLDFLLSHIMYICYVHMLDFWFMDRDSFYSQTKNEIINHC